MASRLDRLISLLDTGSTPSVRLTAARQLGAIAGQRVAHPSAGHAGASQIKSEDANVAGSDTMWRGVDGEWNEVIGLVIRVLPHLQSRSFETRSAAASALADISRAVGIWDPTSTAPSKTIDDAAGAQVAVSEEQPGQLSLADFDVAKVLAEGALLLSSSGTEYGKLSNLSAEELAKAQQDALSKLGLGFGPAADSDIGVDVGAELAAGVEDPDVKIKAEPEVSTSIASPLTQRLPLPPPKFKNDSAGSLKTTMGSISPQQHIGSSTPGPSSTSKSASPAPIAAPAKPASSSVEESDPYAGLSAREKNKLKRQRKNEAKGGSTVTAPPPAKKRAVEPPNDSGSSTPVAGPSASSTQGEVVVIDPGAKAREREGGEVQVDLQAAQERAQMEVKAGEWPWRGTVERLALSLLSPKWETRHGAALGLREILKLQGGGGGRLEGLSHEENAERHARWCGDLCAKLLCVFALDRFGDYLSDQVVAPVRETAAQALAVLLPHMPIESVINVQAILIAMVRQNGTPPSGGLDDSARQVVPNEPRKEKGKYVWQVRHSGLLGLKYLVAVRSQIFRAVPCDIVMKMEDEDIKPTTADLNARVRPWTAPDILLKSMLDAALIGLRDRDDDVRASAASALTPVADVIVDRLPVEMQEIVTVLWECLGDLKDDLSSSVGSVLDLLSKLLGFPQVSDLMTSSSSRYSLTDLIPRLFPFFRHTISSVRLAVVQTITVFLKLSITDMSWVDERLLRLLFQNLIVEDRSDIREASARAWKASLLLTNSDQNVPARAISHIASWFEILTCPIGTALDTRLFWSPRTSLSGQGAFVYNVDKAILAQDLSLVSAEATMRGRIAGATAFGQLMAVLPSETHDACFAPLLKAGLTSDAAFRRFLTATIVEEWATAAQAASPDQTLIPASTLATQLVPSLHTLLASEPPSTWKEMSTVLERIRADCQALYAIFSTQGKVSSDKMPSLPASFGIEQAQQIVNSFNALVQMMGKGARKTTVLPILEERRRKIEAAIGYYGAVKSKHDRQVFASLGGAVVALRAIPVKISALIRSITNSIKGEEDLSLQARSANAIAALIDLCSSPNSPVKTNPSDKLIKNLCTFLCQDVSRTAIFAATKANKKGILTIEYNPARGVATKESKVADPEPEDLLAAKLVYRGAEIALGQLAERFGADLLQKVPKLWSCMSDALLTTYSSLDAAQGDAILAGDDQRGQDLLDCLTVLPTTAQHLRPDLHSRLSTLFPLLALAIRSKYSVVRCATARCFAALCNVAPEDGMRHVVQSVIPVLGDPLNVSNRRGAVELISHLVELLDVKILPYVIFLVVPVLGRMSDPDDDVRLIATNTFASLIKLVPLEAGLPDPPGFSADLLAKRQHEREFLTQLLDGSKVQEYKIPIKIDIELRKYQREGVSWLAFLAKYQLHGLLCDDMGLGKTLQSICILASMHHERAERYKADKSPDAIHLPSLIICPPTLTGHWKHEIKTYAGNLRAVIYSGSKTDRERLIANLSQYDVVIMSYDIARNDIDNLAPVDWHYCILDEGHVIKNGKTKLTKAVKTIKAIHRLILSGTPIQNNVLELWSLFDFLMPGFLGSEKAFNTRFGKPIAASRDAKSSSKEQEAGALALEALHKQVLPFLLRRLKEDVLDDLPPKIIQDYYVELSPLQKQLYDDFSTSQAQQVVGGVSAGNAPPQHVFQALQYLRKLVNSPALVIKRELPQHQAVLSKLASNGTTISDPSHAPKLGALRQILLDCGIGGPALDTEGEAVAQHRVLIFCQLKQMLDIVENDLFRATMPSVTYMRMDGSTDVSKRHAITQTFNADPSIDCLLLTTHVGGLGLNLTGADTVIFIEHDWNPMKDLQAMDRAHRLGQKKVVNVYRLIMRGTLEEKIMGLQKFKLNIASSVVTQQNSDLASLGTDQILDLFNVSAEDAPATAPKDRPMGQKAILEELGDLPDGEEYQDLDFSSFTASLTS